MARPVGKMCGHERKRCGRTTPLLQGWRGVRSPIAYTKHGWKRQLHRTDVGSLVADVGGCVVALSPPTATSMASSPEITCPLWQHWSMSRNMQIDQAWADLDRRWWLLIAVAVGGVLVFPIIFMLAPEPKLQPALLAGWAVTWMPGPLFASMHLKSFLCPHCGYRFYEAHTILRKPSRCARCKRHRNR